MLIFFLWLDGSKRDKMIDINNYVKELFLDVRSKREIVIILQERGPQVKAKMFIAQLDLCCGFKIRKINKCFTWRLVSKRLFSKRRENSILVGDSLTTYKNREKIDNEKPDDVNYIFYMLPPGTTSFLQPREFNKVLKSFWFILIVNQNHQF